MKNLNKFVFIGGGILAVFFVVKIVAAETAPAKLDLPDHLLLKTIKDKILGSSSDSNGDVKYAYQSNVGIDSNPSASVANLAASSGFQITREALDQRTKHSKTFETSKTGVYVTEILSGDPQYYKDDNGTWWQAEYATTTKEAFDQQVAARTLGERIAEFLLPSTHADSHNFYPDIGNPGSATTDGEIGIGGQSTWSGAHDAATGGGMITAGNTQSSAFEASFSGGSYYVSRNGYNFDTSSIGANVVVSTATFSA